MSETPDAYNLRLLVGGQPFTLTGQDGATVLAYDGEIGADFGRAGQWWASRVAPACEAAVRKSFAAIKTEADRQAG